MGFRFERLGVSVCTVKFFSSVYTQVISIWKHAMYRNVQWYTKNACNGLIRVLNEDD